MQDNVLTLGSLFDGVAGFPLAGAMCGIKTLWSSEIEPFCLKVTAARFPDVKQLGSVTDIDGGAVEPVDIISFGSPCQDLSVAGKQLGIHEGQRSNLFFEAVRIIKEMRKADEARGRTGKSIRPRFAVWENVPGAFSSNRGGDFRAVLEALADVAGNKISIPRPARGRWDNAGCVVGDGWSIAWRVYDAQYWGVPQRRRRIYLVADFGSECAGKILFERDGLRGHTQKGETPGEGATADVEGGAGGGVDIVCIGNGQMHQIDMGEKAGALNCMHDQQAVIYPGIGITSPQNGNNPRPGDSAPSLTTDSRNIVVMTGPKRKYIVRRLTPTECARLQGFPDWWAEGLGGSDSAIYKAYGNGLALPCAYDVMNRIARFVEHEKEDQQ